MKVINMIETSKSSNIKIPARIYGRKILVTNSLRVYNQISSTQIAALKIYTIVCHILSSLEISIYTLHNGGQNTITLQQIITLESNTSQFLLSIVQTL